MLPTFMPVATQAAIKGLTQEQVESLGVTLILNNTYHLNLRPGLKVLNEAGGAHKFQGWNRNLLTVCVLYQNPLQPLFISRVIQDSGGFQLVSLSKFTTITEEGALFESPFTGEPTMLTVRDYLHDLILYHSKFYSQRKASQYNTPSGPTLLCSLTT
jgi:queuine tRNA-ribosyltransferase catalytic subunit